ncbi:MAG: hypothetical protein OEM26_13155 [Saprospiraceae bacterium]|nr:hypothetical protein [Saprospiraceae bacterium]
MFEYEEELELSIHRNHRQSSYLGFTIVPNDAVHIVSTAYSQPLWKDFSDFRLLTDFLCRYELPPGCLSTPAFIIFEIVILRETALIRHIDSQMV